ncbi:MAG: hypothetical protein SFX19_07365 [Alphaproteobacteria bacterium]|nr:hypothetical protein [Alphaproteobacteria bacterium]
MELSEAVSQNLFGFVSALIGAVVGGYFTLVATDKAIREENAKENRRDEKEVQNLLDALGVELHALWSFHMRRIGALIEELPAGQPLAIYYPLTQDYFTIYNSNAVTIGRVRDPVLRESIVITYNKCKKVVDGFKYNNELLQAHKEQEMVEYAALIKEDHYELKGYIEELLGLLKSRQR